MNEASDHSRLIELERADAARRALDLVADTLENFACNDLYRKAFRKAAKLTRDLPAREVTRWLNDIVRMPDVNSNHDAQDAPRVEAWKSRPGL